MNPVNKDEVLISTNSSARANFLIEDTFEAGIVLNGTEVKSIRTQSPNIKESYVEVRPYKKTLEAWLLHAHIGPYSHGNIWNHDALRPRKLLLHRHQIERIFGATTQKGFTAVPMRMYFKKGCVKIEIGLGKGKKRHDKRDAIKKRTAEREMDRAVKSGRRDYD